MSTKQPQPPYSKQEIQDAAVRFAANTKSLRELLGSTADEDTKTLGQIPILQDVLACLQVVYWDDPAAIASDSAMFSQMLQTAQANKDGAATRVHYRDKDTLTDDDKVKSWVDFTHRAKPPLDATPLDFHLARIKLLAAGDTQREAALLSADALSTQHLLQTLLGSLTPAQHVDSPRATALLIDTQTRARKRAQQLLGDVARVHSTNHAADILRRRALAHLQPSIK